MRRATRARGGAIPRRRAPARVTYVLQPRSETADAPGGGEARGVEETGDTASAAPGRSAAPPARVTYVLQPRSETVDAPGGGGERRRVRRATPAARGRDLGARRRGGRTRSREARPSTRRAEERREASSETGDTRERGGAIARRRAPARVTYALQPRSETVDAPAEERREAPSETGDIASAAARSPRRARRRG